MLCNSNCVLFTITIPVCDHRIVGSKSAIDTMNAIIDNVVSKNMSLPFVLLVGPDNIGKTTIIEYVISKMYNNNIHTDIVRLYQPHGIGKHNIRIQADSKKLIGSAHGSDIYDYGIRELTQRLHTTSIATYKIAIIENITRLTHSAINAFLKTLEETPSHTMIFATAGSQQAVLPTILSRAMIIRMNAVSQDEISTYLHLHNTSLPSGTIDRISQYSCGRVGIANTLASMPDEERLILLDTFDGLIDAIGHPERTIDCVADLKTLAGMGYMTHTWGILEYYALINNHTTLYHTIKHTKHLIDTNVQIDNACMYFAISLSKKTRVT